jgi:hypothetical protein
LGITRRFPATLILPTNYPQAIPDQYRLEI